MSCHTHDESQMRHICNKNTLSDLQNKRGTIQHHILVVSQLLLELAKMVTYHEIPQALKRGTSQREMATPNTVAYTLRSVQKSVVDHIHYHLKLN